MKLILQITLGVSLGIVLGGSLLHLYTGAFAEQLISAVLKTRPIVVDSSLLPPTTLPPIAPKPIEEPIPAPPSNATPAPIAEINPVVKDAAVIAEEEDQRQMGIKFKASYKKSDKCLSPNQDHDLLVACGNEYIRARDKFEKLWQQGEFKK
jgi:hypothetical protein